MDCISNPGSKLVNKKGPILDILKDLSVKEANLLGKIEKLFVYPNSFPKI